MYIRNTVNTKSTKTANPYSEVVSSLDAEVGFVQYGASNSQGPDPLHYL